MATLKITIDGKEVKIKGEDMGALIMVVSTFEEQ